MFILNTLYRDINFKYKAEICKWSKKRNYICVYIYACVCYKMKKYDYSKNFYSLQILLIKRN